MYVEKYVDIEYMIKIKVKIYDIALAVLWSNFSSIKARITQC